MVAVDAYYTVKLFERAKRKKYDGLGDEEVFISKRTKGHENEERVYKKVCLECKQGKPMTWQELYDFLFPEVQRRRWYLKHRKS